MSRRCWVAARFVVGSVDARTSKTGETSAPIDIQGAAGDVHALTDGSRVSLSRVEGDVEAYAAGGEIEIDGVTGAVVAETRDGAILARFERAPAGLFRTRGGRIDIAFPAEEGVELDAHSAGGCVFVDRDVRSGCGLASAPVLEPINGGGPTLQLRAEDGDIRLTAL